MAREYSAAGGYTYCGTNQYIAPEVHAHNQFNAKSDVYSFGIILWQLITRAPLYPQYRETSKNGE